MKRIVIMILGVLGLAIIGLAGSAYWVGLWAEKQYQSYVNQGSGNPNVRVTQAGYRRGWWTSEAVTHFEIEGTRPQEGKPQHVSFSLKHEMDHGLLPIAWWLHHGFSPRPVQAVVRTVLVQDSDWTRELAVLYGSREPLVITSVIALNGSSEHTVTMPPLDITDQGGVRLLKFSGLQGQFQVAPGGAVIKGQLGVTALHLVTSTARQDSVRLLNLKLAVDQQRSQLGLMIGDSALQLEELQAEAAADPGKSVTLSGLAVSTRVKAQGDLLDGNTDLEVGKVVVAGEAVGKGKLRLSVRKLDEATLVKFQQWGERLESGAPDEAATEELMTLWHELLKRKPELALGTQVNTVQGDLQASADFTLQDPGQLQARDPSALLEALADANAEVSIAKELLEAGWANMLKSQLRTTITAQGIQADEAKLENMAKTQVQQQLAQLVKSDFIRLDGKTYKARARFRDKRLFLNDKEVPLP